VTGSVVAASAAAQETGGPTPQQLARAHRPIEIRELADHVVQLIDSAIHRGKSSTPPFMSPSDLIFLPG